MDLPSAPAARPAAATLTPTEPRSRPGLRVLAIIGPVVALALAVFVPSGLLSLLPEISDDAPDATVVAALVALSLIVCLAAIGLCVLLLRLHGLRLRDAGFRWTRVSLPSLLAGVGIGAAVVVAVGLLLSRLGLLRPYGGADLPWWALVVTGLAQALLLQGLPEELLFRGYQMTALRLRPVAAVFVSSAVFGFIHLISGGGQENALERVLYLATPFGFAVAAGALMIVTGSLWAAVGVHAGVHVGFLVGEFLGIGDGPQLWLLCGAVWTVVGVALLMVARRRGLLTAVWPGPQR